MKAIIMSSIETENSTPTPEKFRSNFRHDLRSIFSVLIGFGEVLREDLAQAKNPNLEEFDTALAKARLLLDDTIQMINHCTLTSIAAFQTEVKNGLRRHTLPELRALNERLTQLEELIGEQELITNILEAMRQLTLRCHSPFERRIELNANILVQTSANKSDSVDNKGPRVMVIDDEPHNLHLIGTFLGRLGLSVVTFTSGHNALRALETEQCDLILLDLHMPAMSGLEFLKTIKADDRFKDIPVLVVTASDDADELTECIEAGAIDSLAKPFHTSFLKARVQTSLELQSIKKREKQYLHELNYQKNRAEEFLAAILPRNIIDELNQTGEVQPKRYENVCVLFCDIVGFTRSCDSQDHVTIINHLQSLFSAFEAIADLHNIQKIKTIGDSFMAVAGLSGGSVVAAELQCVRAGLEMIATAATHPSGWKVRVGIHSGTVTGGLVGSRQFLFDIWGDTVNMASRVEGAGKPQTLTCSKKTFESLDKHIKGQSLGIVELKGKGPQEIFTIEALQKG